MGGGWQFLFSKGTYLEKARTDYYSMLVRGFMKGHTYLDYDADPALANPDPAAQAKARFLLDGSYYRGHYYIYFGVTPAALVLLPYRALTGCELDPRFIVMFASCTGFLFALATWKSLARERAVQMASGLQIALVAILAFGTAVPLLLTRAMFYEVPISTGYALSMAGFYFLSRVLLKRGFPELNLIAASACMGLAVGCRPELVFNIPLLLAGAVLAVRSGKMDTKMGSGWVRAILSCGLPAAIVGLGLAIYNFERFGSPTDFGFNYSTNDITWTHRTFFSPAFIWPNIHWYYLTPPALSPYFPYVFPEEAYFGPAGYVWGEAFHGQFVFFVLAAFVGSSALLIHKGRWGHSGVMIVLLFWAFLVAFATLCVSGVRADRYMVDFQPPLTLAVVLAATAAAHPAKGIGAGRLWRSILGVLSVITVAFNIFAGIEQFSAMKYLRKETYQPLEWWGNYPSHWLIKAGLLKVGPIKAKIELPQEMKAPSVEPIITIGTPELTDSLYMSLYPGGHFQLSGDHHGFGGPSSKLMAADPNHTYALTLDMGAFYPPLNHPYFARYTPIQAHLIKSRFHVELDGQPILNRNMSSFDGPPWTLEAGRNDITLTPAKRVFTGKVYDVRRLATWEPPKPVANRGLWRLRLVLPDVPNGSYPLLASGVAGNGTLIYLHTLGATRISLGMDEWGIGASTSGEIILPEGEDHLIEAFIGPAATRDATWLSSAGLTAEQFGGRVHDLRIWMDGKLVWAAAMHLPFDPDGLKTELGSNPQGFSTAAAEYGSEIISEPFSDAEAREFLIRNSR